MPNKELVDKKYKELKGKTSAVGSKIRNSFKLDQVSVEEHTDTQLKLALQPAQDLKQDQKLTTINNMSQSPVCTSDGALLDALVGSKTLQGVNYWI